MKTTRVDNMSADRMPSFESMKDRLAPMSSAPVNGCRIFALVQERVMQHPVYTWKIIYRADGHWCGHNCGDHQEALGWLFIVPSDSDSL